LHALFESGVSRIQGLEKYITDDVERHGKRLSELEKKITNVYQEFTSNDAIDDDTLFANEDDEEESAFVMYALHPQLLVDVMLTSWYVQGSIHG
jgi:transcriptional activator SPT7